MSLLVTSVIHWEDSWPSTVHTVPQVLTGCFTNPNLDKVPALRNLEPVLNNCNTNNLRIRHGNRCKETEEVKKVSWRRWDFVGGLKLTWFTARASLFQEEILSCKIPSTFYPERTLNYECLGGLGKPLTFTKYRRWGLMCMWAVLI